MTDQELPQYLFKVDAEDGSLLGYVAYAHGLFDDEGTAKLHALKHLGGLFWGNHKITSLPVEQMMPNVKQGKPSTPATLDNVLVDVLYMNDCCVLTVAEYPLESHVRDAEITCTYCNTSFRYVLNEQLDVLVWRWRLRKEVVKRSNEDVHNLGTVVRLIKARHQEMADEAETADAEQDCEGSDTV